MKDWAISDGQKLRTVAAWFDRRDEIINSKEDEVQRDLRRIADRLEHLERFAESQKKRADRLEKDYMECQKRWDDYREWLRFKQTSLPGGG